MEYPVISEPAFKNGDGQRYLVIRSHTKQAWVWEERMGGCVAFGAPIGAYWVDEDGDLIDAIACTFGEKPLFDSAGDSWLSAQLAALEYVSY